MSDCQDCQAAREERAAIHEFDGRAPRAQAERMAAAEKCPAHREPAPEAGPRRARFTVYNLDHGKPPGVGEYIGRPRTLGNPYVIGVHGNREECIAKYKAWMWARVKERGQVFEKLRALAERAREPGGVKLLCHCAPLPCHGQAIADCVAYCEREGIL